MNAPEIVALGGRRFRPVAQGTVQHDLWVMARVRLTGIDHLPKAENESARQYGVRVLETLAASDEILNLLGGLLVPESIEDVDWSPALAAETSKFIGGLTDPDDKVTVQGLTIQVIVPFLESELASFGRFAASSGSAPDGEREDSTAGLATVSATGDSSSGP